MAAVPDIANEAQRRQRVRRTAVILALVAFAFYAGFIAMGVLKA